MFARLKQIAWGALFGILIASQSVSPVWAQTATLLPNAKQQFFSDVGIPLASGTVDFYIPSTNTRKTTWKSSTESVGNQNTNPVLLDAAGRALIYGDGSYRQVVKDSDGNTIWDAVTASTGGGSSGGVASSEGVMVGTIIPWANLTLPAKYLYTAGQAISRATYSDLFTAITFNPTILCQNTIATISVSADISDKTPIGAPVEFSCFAPGTTVTAKSSGQLTLSNPATSTVSVAGYIFPWGNGNGSTTFNVPDLRGRVLTGRDNMAPNGAAGRIALIYYGSNPDAVNAIGGDQLTTLVTANLPPYTPAGTIDSSGSTINLADANGGSNNALVRGNRVAVQSLSSYVPLVLPWTGVAQGGTSTSFSRISPSLTTDYIIKALPDDSPTGPGVSSIQGMTGAISCGTGLTCTANNISASVSMIVGTTAIASGTVNGILFNNAGILGNTASVNSAVLKTDGSGVPSLSTSLPSGLTIPSPTFSGTVAGAGTIPNSVLANASTTVNGVTCTLGASCSIVAAATSIQVGVTTISSATDKNILYNNAGILGQYTVTGTGTVAVMQNTPTLTTPVLGVATGTSLALGGATIGGNALAVTGTSLFNSAVTMGAALTYGGVTLSNAVTGTGNMVLATSPTISGPTISAPVLSGTVTGTYTIGGTPSIAGSAINSGTVSGSFVSAANLASSANGGVTGTLPVANGGTGGTTATVARNSTHLNIEEATSTGDANYVIQAADRMVYHTALSTARTDTLPAANAVNAGQVFYITDFAGVADGTKTVTLQRAGADTINGATTALAINSQYGAGIFWSDGTSKWTFFPASVGGGTGTVTSVTIAAGNGIAVSGTCTISVSGTCTVTGPIPQPQGRITLATNTPVMVATSCSGSPCTNQTTLRYDCYVGAGVPYFDGTNDFVDTISSCEVTDAMVSAASAGQVVASQVYDVWWVHGGANRICLAMSSSSGGGGGWASDTGGSNTARGTGYSQLDRITRPYTTNKNAITNCFNGATNYGSVSANQATYLGTVYANANGQVSYTFGAGGSGGNAGLFGVWNMYNRVMTSTTVLDSGVAYNYTSGTIRQARGSAGNQVSFVTGLAEDGIQASYLARCTAIAASNSQANFGIGLDSTTSYAIQQNIVFNPVSTNGFVSATANFVSIAPQFGFHVISANEHSDGVNANQFDGAGGNALAVTLRN